MSSPIGGFYLNAHNREKATKFNLATNPKLLVHVCVELDNVCLIDESRCGRASFDCLLENELISLSFLPEVIAPELIKLTFSLSISHASSEIAKPMQQVLHLTPAEKLSVLVAGEQRIKITTSAVFS